MGFWVGLMWRESVGSRFRGNDVGGGACLTNTGAVGFCG
jgi:hypothetical protein